MASIGFILLLGITLICVALVLYFRRKHATDTVDVAVAESVQEIKECATQVKGAAVTQWEKFRK